MLLKHKRRECCYWYRSTSPDRQFAIIIGSRDCYIEIKITSVPLSSIVQNQLLGSTDVPPHKTSGCGVSGLRSSLLPFDVHFAIHLVAFRARRVCRLTVPHPVGQRSRCGQTEVSARGSGIRAVIALNGSGIGLGRGIGVDGSCVAFQKAVALLDIVECELLGDECERERRVPVCPFGR